MMWRTPAASRILATAMPAAPRPTISTSRSSIRLPVSLSALRRAASTTTAVPCWSSWNTGMSSSLLQAVLDLEAARRADVLEVDAAEGGRDGLDGRDDLVRVLGVEAQREGVDAAELLEQHRLALHHRHRRRGADVAEPEDGAAVGHDRHGVALDRVLERLVGVVGDRVADPGDAGRVGHREVVAGAQRVLVALLDLAADVHQERAVGGVDDLGAVDLRRRRRRSPCAWSVPAASIVMSRSVCESSIAIRSIEPIVPPASPIAVATRPSMPGRWSIRTRRTNENWAWSDAVMRSI